MLKRAWPLLAFLVMSLCAHASDHESVLDQRKQGAIAPFDMMLSVARSAVGDSAVLLDAQLLSHRSGDRVKIFFRKPGSGQVVVVTLDAASANLVTISDRRRPFSLDRLFSGEVQANSRPNDRSQSLDNQSGNAGSGIVGESSGSEGDEGGKDADGKDGRGKDDGGRKDGGSKNGGKDSGGKSGRSDGKDGGKGGSRR